MYDFNPLLRGQFFGEYVGIKRRPACHGQNISIGRIQSHYSTRLITEQLLRQTLEARIDRQIEIITRDRFVCDDRPLFMSKRIDLHALLSRSTPNLPIKELLDCVLAYNTSLMEIGEFRLFQLLGRDLSNVAEQMRGNSPPWIIPLRLDLDHHSR